MESGRGNGINNLQGSAAHNSHMANRTLTAIVLLLIVLAFINPIRSRFSMVSISESNKFSDKQLSALIAGERKARPFSSCYVSSVNYDEQLSNATIAATDKDTSETDSESNDAVIGTHISQPDRLAMLTVTMPCNLMSPSDNFDHVSWYLLADDGGSWTLLGKL